MSSLVFEKLAQSLAANQTWPLQIAGDFFRIEAAEWPVTVEIMNAGRVVGRMANVRAGDFVRDIAFDQVRILNGATAQAVTVQIAGGGVGSDRVVGEVSVIEGGVQRTKAGQAFWASKNVFAVAGQYSHCQLWNPVGSNKRAVVTELAFDASVANTLVSISSSTAPIAVIGNVAASKLLGSGAVAACELRMENNAAMLGTGMVGLTAEVPTRIQKFSEPIVLMPGSGVMVVGAVVNVAVRGNFQFFEEPL